MEEGKSRAPIPWTRIAAEGVAVVASILLAFAIDARWDSTLEGREEQELLTNLHRESGENRTQLGVRIRNHERLARGASALRNAELRGLPGAWPGSPRDVREEERLGLELVQVQLFPAIARSVSLADLMPEAGA